MSPHRTHGTPEQPAHRVIEGVQLEQAMLEVMQLFAHYVQEKFEFQIKGASTQSKKCGRKRPREEVSSSRQLPPFSHKKGSKELIVCYRCRQQGHCASKCPQKMKATTEAAHGKKPKACYACGQQDHMWKNCPIGKGVKGTNKPPVHMVQPTHTPTPQLTPHGKLICYACQQPGHRRFKCPYKASASRESPQRCYLCRQHGHLMKDCPKGQGALSGTMSETHPVRVIPIHQSQRIIQVPHTLVSPSHMVGQQGVDPMVRRNQGKACSITTETILLEPVDAQARDKDEV